MLTAALEFPPHFSPAAADLLQKLLCADANSRLGAQDGDHLKIKAHRFFQVLFAHFYAQDLQLAVKLAHTLLMRVVHLQDIDWVAGAKQDITSPHAFTHRIAHSQSPSAAMFAAEVCTSALSWLSDF